jgi:hypothetical protein
MTIPHCLGQTRRRAASAAAGRLFFKPEYGKTQIVKTATPKTVGGKRPGAGRPATGRDPSRTFRLSDDFMANVDSWAASQEDAPGRSEAIRRLVEMGLKAKTPSQRLHATRVAQLAARKIEEMVPSSVPAEERAQRRRRLTERPAKVGNKRITAKGLK